MILLQDILHTAQQVELITLTITAVPHSSGSDQAAAILVSVPGTSS